MSNSIFGLIYCVKKCVIKSKPNSGNAERPYIGVFVLCEDQQGIPDITVVSDWYLERENQWKSLVGKQTKIPVKINAGKLTERDKKRSIYYSLDLENNENLSEIGKEKPVNVKLTRVNSFDVNAEKKVDEPKAEESKAEVEVEKSEAGESEKKPVPINNMKDRNFLARAIGIQ